MTRPPARSALLRIAVQESSQVAAARRLCSAFAQRLGFGETAVSKVALVVTELAKNLVKHTPNGGELLLRALERGSVGGVELLALDKGPGVGNPAEALRDGYSTAGSPGTGLGAVRRTAESFDIYSTADKGTVVLARLWAEPPPKSERPDRLEVGVVAATHPKEEALGDGWAVGRHGERSLLLVADGLGHGREASEASGRALEAFHKSLHLAPADLMAAIHAAMRPTRGGVAALAEVDPGNKRVTYVGVGNVSASLLSANGSRGLISHHGTLGQDAQKIEAITYPWPEGALLVMHSDGLTSRWALDRYPGLSQKSATLIAAVLYRDFSRGNDDAAVLVAREAPST